jgi:membrane associated rhomboid family serine protease
MLLNSLCFLIAGGYVERKYGSISLLSLVFVFAFFAENIVYANHGGVSVGFSGVNYSFYAYIIVDFIFTIKEIKNSKVETIISVIVLALIYVAFCFCGGTQSLAFKIYPYDLITNMGHYSSFLTGLTLSLLIKISKVKALSEKD